MPRRNGARLLRRCAGITEDGTELLRGKLKNHDDAIAAILSAIRELMNPPAAKRRGIGFTVNIDEKL